MKTLISIILGLFLLTSCGPSEKTIKKYTVNGVYYSDYTEYTIAHINTLKSPVILIGKNKSLGIYNITVRDSVGTIVSYGNRSYMANGIGNSNEIGDIIK